MDELVFDVFARNCTSRETMEHATGRWGTLSLVALLDGTTRFNALRRDGLVLREARPTIPPHVEYSLTPLGEDVAKQLHELVELLESRMPEVLAAREAYDAR